MNEEDLRDCFAMFAMMGLVMRGIDGDMVDTVSHNAYVMADAMLEARKAEPEQKIGIVAVKSRRKK
jgi:hypothetical protein